MGDTYFLFARPSLIEGLARSIDLGGTLDSYNESLTGEQADFFAIRNDWETIGYDYQNAVMEEENKSDDKAEQIEFEFAETK